MGNYIFSRKFLGISFLLIIMVLSFGCQKDKMKNQSNEVASKKEQDFKLDKNVTWFVTSSPGGGSSIFTQTIADIIQKNKFIDKNIVINYKTDGGGAVGRREVSNAKDTKHTLLTFNAGDLQPLVQQENGHLSDVTPIAVMALDGQIVLSKSDSKYKTINVLISELKNNQRILVAGSRADDEAVFNAIVKEIGGDLEFLNFDSTGEVLTQLLGGHVDIAIAKPAASLDLVKNGDLITLASAGGERFGSPFDAPTFKELGYDIEFQIFRGVVGPKSMTQEETEFWSSVFQRVSNSDEWKNTYISKFLLIPYYLDNRDASIFMQKFEDRFKK